MPTDWTKPSKPIYIANYADWPQADKDRFHDLKARYMQGELLGSEDYSFYISRRAAFQRKGRAIATLRYFSQKPSATTGGAYSAPDQRNNSRRFHR